VGQRKATPRPRPLHIHVQRVRVRRPGFSVGASLHRRKPRRHPCRRPCGLIDHLPPLPRGPGRSRAPARRGHSKSRSRRSFMPRPLPSAGDAHERSRNAGFAPLPDVRGGAGGGDRESCGKRSAQRFERHLAKPKARFRGPLALRGGGPRQRYSGTRISHYRCSLPGLAGFAAYRRGGTDGSHHRSCAWARPRTAARAFCARISRGSFSGGNWRRGRDSNPRYGV
jgi:hypothetical protein